MVEQSTTKALPRNSVIVKVGNQYRLIWNLGDGLGYAWYTVDKEHLKQVYGTETPQVDPRFVFSNGGQFEGRFGNNYWGNAQEISLKSDNPWDDLKDKIFNQFGHVPGLDEPEIRRLLMQAYFEGWTENQWTVEYRRTSYYNNLTDGQRAWAGKSQAEKDQQVKQQATKMAEDYNSIWGLQKKPLDFMDDALKIASGTTLYDSWLFNQRRQAEKQEGTPAWTDRRQQEREGREEGNREENLGLYAEQQWQHWVGTGLPKEFGERWGVWLATGKKSEADLENYLKQISQSRWAYKPAEIPYSDWSSGYKSQIKDELELTTIGDTDPLLKKVLNTDMTGQDLTQLIRQDKRFLSTERMYGELSSAAADMGRRFGFIT